jgi:hypothetical protein
MTLVTGDGNGEGEVMGAVVFGEEEGEEARQLHDVRGGQHSEEQHDGRGGQRQWLASRGR